MKPKNWFLVGLKLFGVWLLLGCVDEVRIALEIRLGFMEPLRSTSIAAYWVHAGANLAVAMYLLAGAPQITALAFGNPEADASDAPA